MQTNKHQDTSDSNINILELLRFLKSHWLWYILSVVLFMSYFMYDYAKTPLVYSRSAMIMIRNSDNTPETIRLRRSGGVSSRTDGAVEIQQLRTKELMRSAIARLNADISYTIPDGLRRKELYSESPVAVSFPDAAPRSSFSFVLTAKDSNRVTIDGLYPNQGTATVNLEDTVQTPAGRMVITPTETYKQGWFGVPVTITKYDQEAMVNYFQGNLSIVQSQNSVPILQISILDRSGVRASDMLYTLINIFNEKSIEEKTRVMVSTGKFISERLSIIEQDLGDVETNLEILKEKNEGLDINTAAGLYIGETREYKSINKELDNRLQMVGYMKQHLENESQINALIPNSTGLGSPDIEQQIVQYNTVVLKRNRLAEGKSQNNPVVQEIDKSLALMRENLSAAVGGLYNRLEKIKMKSVREEIVAREKIRGIPVKQREALSVERQQKVKEELYIYLLNKREENALNGAMTDSNARIIDSPSGSMGPVSPIRLKKMALGAGCGLLFPTFILLLLFKFDTRVRSRKDIEGVIAVPFMGCIPEYKQMKAKSPVVVTGNAQDALSESFRILRTNLGFLAGRSLDKKVITCISFNPGAGKTFVSLNLSACLSLGRKRVVVLDLDLRKGTLSRQTNTRKKEGISNYLSDDTVKIQDIIQHNVLDTDVDLISCGAIAPNPVELLMSERLDQLIEELKAEYDYIVIDNVPVGMVADSAIIDRITDISLFIVRSGKLDRSQLSELDTLYKEHKLKNLAVLLNGVKKLDHYGYGYGYGYGNTTK